MDETYSCPFGNQDCADDDRCLDCQNDLNESEMFDNYGDR